jgi:uncharacterized protein
MGNRKYQTALEHMKELLNQDDCLHTYRVLHYALQILETEPEANSEAVVLSAIFHDVGRIKRKTSRPSVKSHAEIGAGLSRKFLTKEGYPEETILLVSECILTHSRNAASEPQTLEAQILFDADKLDMTGAVGTARAIQEAAMDGKPLYQLDDDGFPLKGKKKESPSLFQDYYQDLGNIVNLFYTEKARKIAIKRQITMDDFFGSLHDEVHKNQENGMKLLKKYSK